MKIFDKMRIANIKTWRRTLYIMFTAQFMVAVGFSSIFPFLPFYVGELGTNTSFSIEFLAGMVYTSQALTMMISAPIWGTLADRMGRKLMVERAMFGGAIILSLQFLRCGFCLPSKNNPLVQIFCPSPKGLKLQRAQVLESQQG